MVTLRQRNGSGWPHSVVEVSFFWVQKTNEVFLKCLWYLSEAKKKKELHVRNIAREGHSEKHLRKRKTT